jgi:hypothetical protein
VVEGPINRRIFETYATTQLAPTLSKGDVVILNNLPAHKSAEAEQAVRARGAWFLLLPPYSPPDALGRAIGDICDLFEPECCRNFYDAADLWLRLNVQFSSGSIHTKDTLIAARAWGIRTNDAGYLLSASTH